MRFQLDPLAPNGVTVVPEQRLSKQANGYIGNAVKSVRSGTNVTVDNTDPYNPIVSATGGGGGAVDSVNGQTGTVVLDAEDILPSQTGNNGKFLTTNGSTSSWGTPAGSGDMVLASAQTVTGAKTFDVGTLLDKGEIVYDVKAYGAVGDGSTDDLAAIQLACDAIRAAGSGVLLLPSGGDYVISGPPVVSSDTTIVAYGARITMPQNVKTNALQNYAAYNNTRLLDVVTDSTTTVTSASASFDSSYIGKDVRVNNPDGSYLDTTVASVTNSTTLVLTDAVSFSLDGIYMCIGSRDRNIRVFGGYWFRDINNFDGTTPNWNSNHLRFRHVDGLEIVDVEVETHNGKYAINVGDCTNWQIIRPKTSFTNSDFIHINGPSRIGYVQCPYTAGSGDDIVAITGGDWRVSLTMTDVYGTVDGLTIDDVYTDVSVDGTTGVPHTGTDGSRGILLCPGRSATNNGFKIDNVLIRNYNGRLGNSPVQIIQDTSDTGTTGGSVGRVIIENSHNKTGTNADSGHFVLTAIDIDRLEVKSAVNDGAATTVYVADGTIDTLYTEGIPQDMIVVGTTGTVTDLQVVKPNGILATDANTFTALQTFQNPGDVGIKTNHIRVYPRSAGGSASMFLDNNNSQTWEFFSNNGGAFGVYDQQTGNQPLTIDAASIDNAIHIDSSKVQIGTELRVNGNIHTQQDNTFVGADDGTVPRVGLVKQAGGGPFYAVGNSESFKVKFNASGNNDIDPADTYTQVFEIQNSGQVNVSGKITNVTDPSSAQDAATKNYVDSGTASLSNKNLTSGTNTFPTFNQNTTGSAAKWTTARNLAGNSVDGSANVAFANKFIVQGTSDSGLSGAQFLGSLGTGLVKNTTTTGVLSIATSGTDYAPATSGSSILKGNGSGGFSNASSGTDYAPATSGSAILKGNGSGGFSSATAGTDYTSPSSTETMTNKRITKRTGTTTSSATPTINTDNVDFYSITAQTVDITSFTTNLSGTPTESQTLWIAITGTASRAITWGSSFEASTVALPTTTSGTSRLDVGFVWNAVTSKWRCVAVA